MGDQIRILDGFADPRHVAFLTKHYEDRPISFLPAFVIRRAMRRWRARPDLFFLVAETGGRPAGFLFGQSVGARPWRKLLGDPVSLPFAIIALAIEMAMKLGRSFTKALPPDSMRCARPYRPYKDAPNGLNDDWGRNDAANVEFIFVDSGFRGRGIAGELLAAFAERAREAGVPTALAFIALGNAASASAFSKAGWEIYADLQTLRAVKSIGRA